MSEGEFAAGIASGGGYIGRSVGHDVGKKDSGN